MRIISDFFKSLQSPEHRLAWLVAIAADFLQLVAWPFFAEGGWSPLDSALDIAVAVILSRLLGWHWAFLPTLAVELVPGLDLFPTWTAAVFFVTRQRVRSGESPWRERPSGEPEIISPVSVSGSGSFSGAVSKTGPFRRQGVTLDVEDH